MNQIIGYAGILLAGLTLIGGGTTLNKRAVGGSGGWGARAAYTRLYDIRTVETIAGSIVAIERVPPRAGMFEGVHLKVRTKAETLSVHLGPAWYLDRQDTGLMVEDLIEARGSRITFEGKPALIAARVVRGDDVLELRDETGAPFWAAWRGR